MQDLFFGWLGWKRSLTDAYIFDKEKERLLLKDSNKNKVQWREKTRSFVLKIFKYNF